MVFEKVWNAKGSGKDFGEEKDLARAGSVFFNKFKKIK